MARKKAMTRADMIALLKSRGTKGRLSKMTKPQLKALLEKTAPPGGKHSADEKPPKGDLELEPDDQDGGHFYRKDGTTRSDGKHEHEKNPWPTEKSKAPAPAPKPKARKKKLDPIEDPDADITVDLVNGQARFVQNSVVLENQNHLYDAAMVQLLTTQNQEGPSPLEGGDNFDSSAA